MTLVEHQAQAEKDQRQGLPYMLRKAINMAEPGIPGRLQLRLWDGRQVVIGNGKPGRVSDICVHNPKLFSRLFSEGWLGFSEAYLEGWWSTDDLQGFMDHMHEADLETYDSFTGGWVSKLINFLTHYLRSNSRRQARKNISYHYDLGNDFYAEWLDDTMTYSSAIFDTGQESLEAAQTRKYASMIDQMGAQPGDHILEIGCGWGGFAEYAAKERGMRVTGLTISKEQLKYARERIEKAGVSDLVTLKLQDYRDERGTYDGIASIEMFEAVGEKYWPVYFKTVFERLKPGKTATFQIITVEDARFEAYRNEVDFIQKYIFPGGMLPSPTALRQQVNQAGLRVVRSIEFGKSYSQTLRRWHETFNARWPRIEPMGFDARFQRMWNFYLTSCAATFEHGNCDVTQLTVTRPV